MTCIAGLVDDGTVYLAGDRAASTEEVVVGIQEPKVFRFGEMVIGAAGGFRPAQVLQHAVKPPKAKCRGDAASFLVLDFIPTLRKAMQAHGLDNMSGTGLLVGLKGRLFELGEDFGITETSSGFAAIGTGAAYALGAWYAAPLIPGEYGATDRLLLCLRAAETFTPGVRAPFDVVTT